MDAKAIQEIKRELRETKREMKAMGIRRISFMNAGLTPLESSYNCKLFELKTRLDKASR